MAGAGWVASLLSDKDGRLDASLFDFVGVVGSRVTVLFPVVFD